jgi:methyl-accepting chemotaxis protein
MFRSRTLIMQQQMLENLKRENESLNRRLADLEKESTKEREVLSKVKTAIAKRYAMLLKLLGRDKTAFQERPVQTPAVTDDSMTGTDEELDHLMVQVEVFQQSVKTMKSVSQELERMGINTAAEAIRASKRGKGFLLVAEEINRLSDHSKRSVEEAMRQLQLFTEITRTLSQDFSKTVESIEKEMDAFAEIRKLMDEQLPTYKKENRETRDRM